MKHSSPNLLTRRSFLDQSLRTTLGVALSGLIDVPPLIKQALAEGNIGLNGKKVLFIFLRGANDALNSVIPIEDPAYRNYGVSTNPDDDTRPIIGIKKTGGVDYTAKGPCFDATQQLAPDGSARTSADPVYSYTEAIRLGNGFAALHPALKFLAPVYNAGNLCLIHRVGYPRQSRSHFDSQAFWETGAPYSTSIRDGLLYRAMVESGLATSRPLTGVSIQRSLPLILRGSQAAMTNLTDTDRYSLLGLPGVTGVDKSSAFLSQFNDRAYASKNNRDMLHLQYQNLAKTLDVFGQLRPNFDESGNTFRDDVATDGDTEWFVKNGNQGYYLFPTTAEKNGGWLRPDASKTTAKYVVPQDNTSTEFFNNLKAAALVLNKTDAIVAGTQLDGFDTHSNQGGATGAQANLLRRIGWALYALQKYFTRYADKAAWKDVVVVTMTEFGRTTVQNSDGGTDHAEAGVMWVAGGSLKGYDGVRSGVIGCSPNDPVKWVTGPANQAVIGDGSMFGVDNRYLRRAYDYRSVMGEIIRKHLGSTQAQLNRIIPGYADPRESLLAKGTSTIDGTPIAGEPGIL